MLACALACASAFARVRSRAVAVLPMRPGRARAVCPAGRLGPVCGPRGTRGPREGQNCKEWAKPHTGRVTAAVPGPNENSKRRPERLSKRPAQCRPVGRETPSTAQSTANARRAPGAPAGRQGRAGRRPPGGPCCRRVWGPSPLASRQERQRGRAGWDGAAALADSHSRPDPHTRNEGGGTAAGRADSGPDPAGSPSPDPPLRLLRTDRRSGPRNRPIRVRPLPMRPAGQGGASPPPGACPPFDDQCPHRVPAHQSRRAQAGGRPAAAGKAGAADHRPPLARFSSQIAIRVGSAVALQLSRFGGPRSRQVLRSRSNKHK